MDTYKSLHLYPEIRIHDNSDPICRGNECSVTCAPFNPNAAVAYELTGTLRVEKRSSLCDPGLPPDPNGVQGCPLAGLSFALVNIDLEASSELVGDGDLSSMRKQPIATGSFVVSLH